MYVKLLKDVKDPLLYFMSCYCISLFLSGVLERCFSSCLMQTHTYWQVIDFMFSYIYDYPKHTPQKANIINLNLSPKFTSLYSLTYIMLLKGLLFRHPVMLTIYGSISYPMYLNEDLCFLSNVFSIWLAIWWNWFFGKVEINIFCLQNKLYYWYYH